MVAKSKLRFWKNVPKATANSFASKYKVGYSQEQHARFLEYVRSNNNLSPILPCVIPALVIPAIVFPLSFLPFPTLDKGYLYHGIMPVFSFFSAFFGSTSVTFYAQHFFPEFQFKRRHFIVINTVGAVVFVGTIELLASKACYPFPFSTLIASNAAIPFLCFFMYHIVIKEVRHLEIFWKKFRAFALCVSVMWLMFLIYPASVQMLYLARETTYGQSHDGFLQLLFAIYLFILRRVLKIAVIRICEYGNRPSSLVAVLIVHGYHAVYLSIMLQDIIQWRTLAVITLGDVAGMMIDYIRMKKLEAQPLSDDVYMSHRDTPSSVETANVDLESQTSRTVLENQRLMLILAENFVLIEYVECIIPMLLAIFSFLVSKFPWNKDYILLFEGMDESEMKQAQQLLWVYSFSEIIVLAIAIPIFIGRLDFPFWKHLGFVLTENRSMLIALVSLWLLQTIASSVKHLHSGWNFDCAAPP